MDAIFNLIMYSLFGFFGLIFLLVVLAVLFGNRVIKQWDYQAEFRNDRGKEIAEFEIELSRIDKKEPDCTLKVEFWLRHEALKVGTKVQVYLDDELVMEGSATDVGRIRLGKQDLRSDLNDPRPGQICVIKCDGDELLRETLRKEH